MKTVMGICLLALQLQAQETSLPVMEKPPVEGPAGTPEGHAIAELQYWISWEDYDLAEAAYRLGCKKADSSSVRFLRSWGLLRWAVAKGKGFDRAVAALEEVRAPDAPFRDHVGALIRSIRAVMPCAACDG